jgi:hypothetical protein
LNVELDIDSLSVATRLRQSVNGWRRHLERHSNPARTALYLFILLVACPVRYWPLEDDLDPTWRFALNYAPAHGYVFGRDYIYTTGPLAQLTFPQNVGHNLTHGLIFQGCLWLVLAAILADVFFLAGFRFRNLVLFSALFSLAAPFFWFLSVGLENLVLAGALLLLIRFHRHGGWIRYTTALLLIGLLPLLKMSAGLIGSSAIAGFLIDRFIERRWKAGPELLLAVVIPASIACGTCLLLLPSASGFMTLLRASAETIGGYNSAMSLAGLRADLLSAAEAAAVLLLALSFQAQAARPLTRFYCLLLAGPFLMSVKHGFVRHDLHTINYFCFVALALALVSLTLELSGETVRGILPWLIVFVVIWQGDLARVYGSTAVARASGVASAKMLAGAFPLGTLGQRLDAAVADFPQSSRIEPELVALVGQSPIASLSDSFTNVAVAGLHLTLYPTIQRFSAYTPWLDRWDAAWIRDKGPAFLLFDGKSIDGRDPWMETPAMWLEVYRWYDTRAIGSHNVLLARRTAPRFRTLETIGRFSGGLREILIPRSGGPVFWTMNCGYTVGGLLRKTFASIPAVMASIHETGGTTRDVQRVLPEVFVSPVFGNDLPGDLAQFAAVLSPGGDDPGFSVDRIRFGGDGISAFTSSCEGELSRPVK